MESSESRFHDGWFGLISKSRDRAVQPIGQITTSKTEYGDSDNKSSINQLSL